MASQRPRTQTHRRTITGIAILQVCLAAATVGCGKPERPAPPAKTAPLPEEPRRPKQPAALRVHVEQLPAQLNPLVSFDVWCQLATLHTIFEPLVTVTAAGGYQPHLAASMEVTAGGRHYLFRLRPGVQFHDGRPLTSTDVKMTFDKLLARNAPSELLKVELGDIEEVRAPDAERVELRLRRPNHLLPAVLAEVPILAAHLHGRFGLRNAKLNWMPVGSGPYRVTERKVRESVVLEPFDKYWGARPRLPRIVFTAIADPARAMAALRNGELDLLPQLYPGYYPDQLASARLKDRFRALRIHPYRLRLMVYNTRHPALRDRRVRAALERLADRERIMRSERSTLAQLATAPLYPLSNWYDNTVHAVSFDRAAAARLLNLAGWTDAQGSGHRARGKRPLRLRLVRARESAEMSGAAQILKADLRAAGIDAEVEVADFGYLRAQLKRGNFEVALIGLAPRIDADLSPLLHSKGELNYGGYANAVVDSLLEALRGAASPEERQRIALRLHRALHEDPPFTILYAPVEILVAHRRVRGLANNGRWPRLTGLSLADEP